MNNEKEDVCRIKPDECEACRFETAELSFYAFGSGYPSKSGGWLCKVCGSTDSGSAYYSPSCYKSPEVLHMLAYCTNLIIKEIERVR
jgi:hypothetical protein